MSNHIISIATVLVVPFSFSIKIKNWGKQVCVKGFLIDNKKSKFAIDV